MDKANLKLAKFLPYCLSVLSNEISHNISVYYQERFEIDMSQWRVMAILGEDECLSAAEVAKRTAMDKVAVSRAVKKLLAKKMLEREFAEDDKRRSILKLSQQGLVIYNEIVPMAKDYESRLVAQLSTEELELLNQLISKLREANQELSLTS